MWFAVLNIYFQQCKDIYELRHFLKNILWRFRLYSVEFGDVIYGNEDWSISGLTLHISMVNFSVKFAHSCFIKLSILANKTSRGSWGFCSFCIHLRSAICDVLLFVSIVTYHQWQFSDLDARRRDWRRKKMDRRCQLFICFCVWKGFNLKSFLETKTKASVSFKKLRFFGAFCISFSLLRLLHSKSFNWKRVICN